MSFKCYVCGKVSSKPVKKVLETRKRIYPERKDREGNVIDKGGMGMEIVKEVDFCQECAKS